MTPITQIVKGAYQADEVTLTELAEAYRHYVEQWNEFPTTLELNIIDYDKIVNKHGFKIIFQYNHATPQTDINVVRMAYKKGEFHFTNYF